jgi:hypothetical protein
MFLVSGLECSKGSNRMRGEAMTARELHDRLGRLLDERVIDADAEVLARTDSSACIISVIEPVTVNRNTLKELFQGNVSLCFGRLK